MSWLYTFTHQQASVLFTILYSLRVFGREKVPLEGPVLLLSNHQSFLDPVLCAVGLNRGVNFMARDSLFTNPLFGRYISALNAFPVKRGHADVAAIKEILKRLKKEQMVLLFPEATRTHNGRIRPIKSGFELISRRSGAAIVPMVIDGAFEAWPRQNPLPSLGRVYVQYDDPITPGEQKKLGKDVVKRVNQRMREMQNALRKQYGRKPFVYDSPL